MTANPLCEVREMSHKEANEHIRCRVTSCDYHCADCDFCSLPCIQVEPCVNCSDGKAADESMCASYKCCR